MASLGRVHSQASASAGANSPEPTAKPAEKKLQEVAGLYEKQFLRDMVKAMRATVGESGLIKKNQAEQIFREQLDNELVEKWGDQGGVGLQKMIYEQLIEKFGQRMGLKAPIEKPLGPFSFSEKDTMSSPFARGSTEIKNNLSGLQMRWTQAGSKEPFAGGEVLSPWQGSVLFSSESQGHIGLLDIEHDNGLRSKFAFPGQIQVQVGQKIQAGQKLGTIQNSSPWLTWNSVLMDQE